ncbi:MAG: hypothetical protein WC683_06695 [bacterium]
MGTAPPNNTSAYAAYTSKQTLIRDLQQACRSDPLVMEIVYRLNRSNLADASITDGATVYGTAGFWESAE